METVKFILKCLFNKSLGPFLFMIIIGLNTQAVQDFKVRVAILMIGMFIGIAFSDWLDKAVEISEQEKKKAQEELDEKRRQS